MKYPYYCLDMSWLSYLEVEPKCEVNLKVFNLGRNVVLNFLNVDKSLVPVIYILLANRGKFQGIVPLSCRFVQKSTKLVLINQYGPFSQHIH